MLSRNENPLFSQLAAAEELRAQVSEVLTHLGNFCTETQVQFFRALLKQLKRNLVFEKVSRVEHAYLCSNEGRQDLEKLQTWLQSAVETVFTQDDLTITKISLAGNIPALLKTMSKMKGNAVTGSHGGVDPTTHTLAVTENMLDLVVASNLPRIAIAVELVVALFHDAGKVFGPKREMHPQFSWMLAEPFVGQLLEFMENNFCEGNETLQDCNQEAISNRIKFLIVFHDLCGHIDSGRVSMADALQLLLEHDVQPQQLLALWRIQEADMLATVNMRPEWIASNRRVFLEVVEALQAEAEPGVRGAWGEVANTIGSVTTPILEN